MPTKRTTSDERVRYYIKRRFPALGLVYRSLGTSSLTRARKLEGIIESIHESGHIDVLRAWLDGEVELREVVASYEAQKLGSLIDRLNAPEVVTLADAIERAMTDKAPDVAPSTLQRYREGLAHFQGVLGASEPVGDALTTEAVKRFKAERLRAGAAKETINNDLIAVGILTSYAQRREWIKKRPAVKKFPGVLRIRYLDKGEVTAYMAALRPAFRVQMHVLLWTGMRLGETEAVTPDHIQGDRIRVEDAKTAAGVRSVIVPPWVAETLEEYIEAGGYSGSDRLFTIKRRTVQAEHKRACRLAGISDYSIHDHRHTYAVAMVRAGIPMPMLQAQLGHKSITTTMKYAAFHPDYHDVTPYFNRVAEAYGFAAGDSSGNTTHIHEDA